MVLPGLYSLYPPSILPQSSFGSPLLPETHPITLGSCPGYGYGGNEFIPNFLELVVAQGIFVASFPTLAEIDFDAADVVIIHWPEKFFYGNEKRSTLLLRASRKFLFRPRRCRLIWLVHDLDPVQPRANALIWPLLRRYFERTVDGFMTLSPATLPVVRERFRGLRDKPGLAIWHPPYRDALLPGEERMAARAAKGISPGETVIGYAGIMQLYKGVGKLLAAFQDCTLPGIRLYLAGRPPRPVERETIEAAARADPRIILDFGAKSATEFRQCMNVIDKFVAPLSGYLHSGSLIHALCVHSQVLTPAMPYAAALEAEVGRGWLRTYEGELTGSLLSDFVRMTPPDGVPDLRFMSAERNAPALGAFLRRFSP